MTLRKTIEVVTKLANQGVIEKYAITGAVAALNYIEPMLTEDLDILASVGSFPLEDALAKLGYTDRKEVGIDVEGWPVQFLPVASKLDAEALEQAAEVEFQSEGDDPIKARILRAEHVVANAVKVGRLKDLARVEAFLDQKAVDLEKLKPVLERHGLMAA
jgi:hypothetical protein